MADMPGTILVGPFTFAVSGNPNLPMANPAVKADLPRCKFEVRETADTPATVRKAWLLRESLEAAFLLSGGASLPDGIEYHLLELIRKNAPLMAWLVE